MFFSKYYQSFWFILPTLQEILKQLDNQKQIIRLWNDNNELAALLPVCMSSSYRDFDPLQATEKEEPVS